MSFDVEDVKIFSRPDQVDEIHWQALERLDPAETTRRTGAAFKAGAFELELLGQVFRIDPRQRRVTNLAGDPVSFQEALVLLVYLGSPFAGGLGGERVPFRQLNGGAAFFTKSHALATSRLAEATRLTADEFRAAGRALGARSTSLGDASWLLLALPNLPLEAIYFQGDEEFPARITLLVDSLADRRLDLASLWAVVNLLARRIKKIVEKSR